MFKKPIKIMFKEWNHSRGYTMIQPIVLFMQNITLDYLFRFIQFCHSTGYRAQNKVEFKHTFSLKDLECWSHGLTFLIAKIAFIS